MQFKIIHQTRDNGKCIKSLVFGKIIFECELNFSYTLETVIIDF